MGIKNLFKLRVSKNPDKYIDDFVTLYNIKELRGKLIAIDALNIIYANMFATRGEHMKSANGEITTHIAITLRQILYYKKNGIKQLWIFDSAKPIKLKAETIARRKIKLSGKNINDIKILLTYCGIDYIETPAGIEAENYAATLTKPLNNKPAFCFAVISNDSDVIMLGGRLLRKKGNTFKLYDGRDIRKKINISCADFIKIGIILGSDFAPKTPSIGPKTVLAKYKTIKLTERQQSAFDYLIKKVKISKSDYRENKFNSAELINYLAGLNFGKKTIDTAIKVLN